MDYQAFSRLPYNNNNNNNMGGGGSNCQMTNQCCGMEKQQCCMQGMQKQNCYTVWDRQCQEGNLKCPVTTEEHCHTVTLPDCRIEKEVISRSFPMSNCVQKSKKLCFDYEAQICDGKTKQVTQTITWENQKLKKVNETIENHCINVQSKDCKNITINVPVTKNVRKERVVNDTVPSCNFVSVRMPDRKAIVTVMKTVNRPMCYNIQVPICSTSTCVTTGYCVFGTSVCSNDEFNTVSVCPEAANGGLQPPGNSGCQQVQQPVCYGQHQQQQPQQICNVNYQQCCSYKSKKICKNVPQRVPMQVEQTMPGGTRWEKKCSPNPVSRTEYYWEPVTTMVPQLKIDCQPITKQECHNYATPNYVVVNEKKTDDVEVSVSTCETKVEKKEFCTMVTDAETICTDSTMTKGFQITKIRCDRQFQQQQCFTLPVARCSKTQPNCQMVPRQVCQPTCSLSQYCLTCDNFRQGPGFGSCPTSTCGQYYPGNDSPFSRQLSKLENYR
jgi:hypothetical protein